MCVLLIAAVGLVGCDQASGTSAQEATTDPDATAEPTLPPQPQAGRAVVADGQLVSLFPPLALGFGDGLSGQVTTVTVQAGDLIQAGDLVAVLDDAELQRAVADAQVTLDRAVADHEEALRQWERDVTKAEQALAQARRDLAVARLRHSEIGLEEARVSLKWAQRSEADRKGEYDKAVAAWPPIPVDEIRAAWQHAVDERKLAEMRLAGAENEHSAGSLDLQACEAEVTKAEQSLATLKEGIAPSYRRAIQDTERELARAQEILEHAHLVAPWAAIVLSVDVAPEASVEAGVPVVTLLSMGDGLRFVTRDLSEQHIAGVYAGQRAVVTLRTFADVSLEGTVEALVPQVEEGVVTDAHFTVRVRLIPVDPQDAAEENLRLLPGMTGRVEVFVGSER
jgi:HlyD family secretion protein